MPPIGRIDCHIHYMPLAIAAGLHAHLASQDPLLGVVASRPAWRDLSAHLELMDQANVELAVVIQYGTALLDGLRSLGGSFEEALATYNQALSDDLAAAQGRILGAALVDPFGGKAAISQLERSLSLPFMAGISLVASYDGIALDDAAFQPIFDVARDHDVPVLVHPSSVAQDWVDTLRLDRYFLRSGFGYLLDDTLCILRMAIGGTFDRYHDVRFMFCQLGGMAPFCCDRWEYHHNQAKILQEQTGAAMPAWFSRSLRDYLSHIWLDTHTQDRHAIRLVIEEAGDDVVVLGGDHPWTPADRAIPYTMSEVLAAGLSEETQRKIQRDNALKLLGPRLQAQLLLEPGAAGR